MSVRSLMFAPLLGVLMAASVSAQSGPDASEAPAMERAAPRPELDAETLRAEFTVLREAFEAQADALAHGLLPTRIDRGSGATALPAAGGGGATGALGSITSAFGPISNSIASLTFERDPTLSNGTSETFAMIGLGSAVVGGVLNLISSGGGDAVAMGPRPGDGLVQATGGFEENQSAAERLIDQFERLSEDAESLIADLEEGSVTPTTLRLADTILRRGERSILRFDYVTRNAVSQLAILRSGLESGVARDATRQLHEVDAAEIRLHRALDGVREFDASTAFSRVTRLRGQLGAS